MMSEIAHICCHWFPMCVVVAGHSWKILCFSGSRRGRPKREENQEEKPKDDDNEQETSNDAANEKSDEKLEVNWQGLAICHGIFLSLKLHISQIIRFLDFVHHFMFQKIKFISETGCFHPCEKIWEAFADWLHQKDVLAITGQIISGNSLYVCTWDQVLFARGLMYFVYMYNSSMVQNQCLCYWFSLMILILTFWTLFQIVTAIPAICIVHFLFFADRIWFWVHM